jgi:hypothetical protein
MKVSQRNVEKLAALSLMLALVASPVRTAEFITRAKEP